MRYSPYAYQRRAEQFVLDNPRCVLWLSCGLGKTVVTLSAIQELIDTCEVTKALVVAPKKVAETTWSDEAGKWDHLSGLRVSVAVGSVKERTKALEADADVYVINRDCLVWLCGHYNGRLPYDMIVLDELTTFKNASSKRWKALKISTKDTPRVIGLTGTPVPNGYIDLWAEMYCIDRGERLGPSLTRYRDAYFHNIVWNNVIIKSIPKKGSEEAIRAKLKDICLSMRAEDYIQLPDMMVQDVKVHLSAKVMAGYKSFERECVMDVDGEQVTAVSAAALMSKLSQYSNGAVYNDDHTVSEIHDEKLESLKELVESAAGEQVLVYYQFRHDVPRITRALKGYRIRKYEGPDDLKAWNGHEVDVLLAHPASTAYGLNMQEGGHIIVWYGLGWDLELYDQANARLHRQGQGYPVTVFRLISEGTVDERAVAALASKDSAQAALMKAMRAVMEEYR